MRRRVSLIVVLSLLVVLSGCTGGVGGGPSDDATRTSPTPTWETVTKAATPTPTPTPEYSAPQTPNRPTEIPPGGEVNLVVSGEFVNRVESESGSGYSDFDVNITANTSMPNVDPPEYGTVHGEPYALVLVNGELVERSPELERQRYGQFTIGVHPGALRQFEPGTLEVKVMLMDQDSQYDDVYGTWTGTIEYGG